MSSSLSPAIEQVLVKVHIPHADPSWELIMQSGVNIPCTVGIPLAELLHEEFGLSPGQLAPVDVLLLDGMPVDEPENCIVPDAARIALASGLPGIAGLAMKKGSAVRGLRSGITHTQVTQAAQRPGIVSLALYSLTLPLLAGHFLERGVILSKEQFLRYARLTQHSDYQLEDRPVQLTSLEENFAALPASASVLMTATFMSTTT